MRFAKRIRIRRRHTSQVLTCLGFPIFVADTLQLPAGGKNGNSTLCVLGREFNPSNVLDQTNERLEQNSSIIVTNY
jgi:hypothetical protein